ncbi:MAG: cupin domain-containing protein [Methylophilaceae bacterium]
MNNIKNTLRSKITANTKTAVLNDEINAAIANRVMATTPAPEVAERIRARLMQRIQSKSVEFVFANQGEWRPIAHGVEVKLLHKIDKTKSFLIKMAANTSISAHIHSQDEESFVIDGEVWLEGILCHSGDYHYAQAGSQHEKIHTARGCTLLVRSI